MLLMYVLTQKLTLINKIHIVNAWRKSLVRNWIYTNVDKHLTFSQFVEFQFNSSLTFRITYTYVGDCVLNMCCWSPVNLQHNQVWYKDILYIYYIFIPFVAPVLTRTPTKAPLLEPRYQPYRQQKHPFWSPGINQNANKSTPSGAPVSTRTPTKAPLL